MFHFPDSDTGYYDREEAFYALDALHEAAVEREYLAELEASYDGGPRKTIHTPPSSEPDYRQIAVDLARDLVPFADPDRIDPETGCTAAEMNDNRMRACAGEREIHATPQTQGKVA